jgi:hypothetical protein
MTLFEPEVKTRVSPESGLRYCESTTTFCTVTPELTVNAAVPDTPDELAVMVEVPSATAVASPAEFIVAVELLEELHVAVEVMSLVDPSL